MLGRVITAIVTPFDADGRVTDVNPAACALFERTSDALIGVPAAAILLGFEEAGRSHGGAGALYVRLRRRERR